MKKVRGTRQIVNFCDICGEECITGYVSIMQGGIEYHGCSAYEDTDKMTHTAMLAKRLAGGDLPEQKHEEPDAEAIVSAFMKVGMRIELGAQFSVRGQIAQLIEGVRGLLSVR